MGAYDRQIRWSPTKRSRQPARQYDLHQTLNTPHKAKLKWNENEVHTNAAAGAAAGIANSFAAFFCVNLP